VIEVEIRNFQSIEEACFKIDGYTALVGRSNIGKSALVRAIRSALTGASGTAFVRHGPGCLRRLKKSKACKCYSSVHLKGQNFDLLWQKGDSVNRYTFNGRVYDRADRGTPEFLQPFFTPVKVGDKQEVLQVSDQFTPIFLLDQSGGVVADVLSDVAHLDRINVAMRLAERDRKEAVSTRKIRENDIAKLQKQVERFDGLDEVSGRVQGVEDSLAAIDSKKGELDIILKFLETGSALAIGIQRLERASKVEVPDAILLSDKRGSWDLLVQLHTQLKERHQAWLSLKGVDEVEIPSPQALTDDSTRLEVLVGWLTRREKFESWLSQYPAVDQLPVLASTELKESWDQLVEVEGLVKRYTALTEALSGLEAEYVQVIREEKLAQEEIRAIGACPTCSRPVDGSHDCGV
jgi:hypothetical protein